MATIQRINIIGSREGSRNRRRLKANQTGKKFRVGIKSNISTNRNNLRSEERFSRNAETDLVCRLLLEKKKGPSHQRAGEPGTAAVRRACQWACRDYCARAKGAFLFSMELCSSREASVDLLRIYSRQNPPLSRSFLFFNNTTTSEIYTLSLHDALPIFKANQTGKKFRVGIKSNISTNRNNLISGVDRCIHLNAMKKTTITSINRQTIKI